MGFPTGKVYKSSQLFTFYKTKTSDIMPDFQKLPSMHLYFKAGGRLPLYNCGTQRPGGGCGRGEQF